MPSIKIVFLSFLFFSSCYDVDKDYSINGFTMGTTYAIKIISKDVDIDKTTQAIENILYNVNIDMSTYIDSSEISKFNRFDNDKDFPISNHFYNVLKVSRYFSDITDGKFDITIKPLVDLWEISKKSNNSIPSDKEVSETLKHVGIQNLFISDTDLTIAKKNNVSIDVSAIAKGYAVDIISEYLINNGMDNHMVEIGGEVKVSGLNLEGKKWLIGVQYPSYQRSSNEQPYSDKNTHTVIKISNISIATSGDYRNFIKFNGRRYSHIISPVTGYPVENKVISVSVLSEECLNADALATGLMVMGVESGIKLVEDLDGYEALFILEDNSTVESTGFKDFLN